MDRRQFFLSGGATAVVAMGMPSVGDGASSREWAQLLKVLRHLKGDLDRASDWINWGHEATLALGAKEAPPPSPASPAVFYEMLLDQRARIESVSMPDFAEELPSTAAVNTDSLDSVRQDIRRRVMRVQACVAEVQEAQNTVLYYEVILVALQDQEDRLRRLNELAKGIISKLNNHSPGFVTGLIQQDLMFKFIELENSYIPTVVETTGIAKARRNATSSEITKRVSLLEDSISGIYQLLIVEKIGLQIEHDHLVALYQEVESLAIKVKEARQDEAVARQSLDRSEIYLHAIKADLQEAEGAQADAQQLVEATLIEVENARKNYNEPYICPISGESWSGCQNADHIIYKQDYSRKREQRNERLSSLEQNLRDYKEEVSNVARKLNFLQQALESAEQDVIPKREALNRATAELDAASRKHFDRKEHFSAEKWRTRVDLYWTENSSDKAELDVSMTKLRPL